MRVQNSLIYITIYFLFCQQVCNKKVKDRLFRRDLTFGGEKDIMKENEGKGGENPLKKQTGKKAELLCPAGSPAALFAAIEAGADAVYLGGA